MAKKSLSLDEQKKMVGEASEDVAVEEVKAEPPKETKLEKALRELQVAPIPNGLSAINDLNVQVQRQELRIRALEGTL